MNPIFSIITVVYNGERNIEDTMKSVLSQDKSLFEYIIIDGDSTDRTMEIINKYNTQIDIIISEKDNGVYDAMNKGINVARGKWVIFMNTGDLFVCEKTLAKIGKEILNIGSDIFYGDTIVKMDNKLYYIKPHNLDYLLLNGMPFVHQSVLVKRELLLKRNFNLQYKILSDFDMFRSFYLKDCSFTYLSFPISIYAGEGGLSDSNRLTIFRERAKITENHNTLGFFLKLNILIVRRLIILFIPHRILIYMRHYKYRKLVYNSIQ